MKYRPPGFKNPFPNPEVEALTEEYLICAMQNPLSDYAIFESGADAMLEGLKNKGVFTYGNHIPDIGLDDAPGESGYWAFIPDDTEEVCQEV